MANDRIVLEVTSTIKVDAKGMRYILAPLGSQPGVVINVKEWSGMAAKADPFTSPGSIIPNDVCRLIFELLMQEHLPKQFSLSQAWVTLDSGEELVVYDCARSGDTTILNGMFTREVRLFGQLESVVKDAMKNEIYDLAIPSWAQWAGFAVHNIRIEKYEIYSDPSTVITIVDECSYIRYPMGEYCRVLPIPPFPKDFKSNPSNAVVIAKYKEHKFHLDTATWEKLEMVNQVVRGGKQIIFLTGSPGSGKELFTGAIHYLSGRDPDRKPRSLSAAGLSFDRLEKYLGGEISDKGHHVPGDIEQARGGTLMLDEFDKAGKNESEREAFYRWLLRVLESEEYRAVGGDTTKRVKDVTWILAGAFEKGYGALPEDFWSRLSSHLKLPDPPDVNDEEDFIERIAAMFLYWYFVLILKNSEGLDIVRLVDSDKNDFQVALTRKILGITQADDTKLNSDLEVIGPKGWLTSFLNVCVQDIRVTVKNRTGGNFMKLFNLKSPVIGPRTIRQAARATVETLLFNAKGLDPRKIIYSGENDERPWGKACREAKKAACRVVKISLK